MWDIVEILIIIGAIIAFMDVVLHRPKERDKDEK